MTAAQIAGAIIEALTSALSSMTTQIGSAIKNTFEGLFFTTTTSGGQTTTEISTFAIVMLVFGSVALAFGLTRLVYHLVANKIGA